MDFVRSYFLQNPYFKSMPNFWRTDKFVRRKVRWKWDTVNSWFKKVHFSFLKSRVVWFKKDLCSESKNRLSEKNALCRWIWNLRSFLNREFTVFCFQNCFDQLWEKIVLVMEKNFSKFLRLLEKCIRTVKGQFNFWNRMLFYLIPEGFSDLINYNN